MDAFALRTPERRIRKPGRSCIAREPPREQPRSGFEIFEGVVSKNSAESDDLLRCPLARRILCLANYCPANLHELNHTARAKLKSAQRRPSIIAACWVQAGLW